MACSGDSRYLIREDAARANRAYSDGVARGGFIAISGQAGLSPDTGELLEGLLAQTQQALSNLADILKQAGGCLSDLIMVRIYLADKADIGLVDDVYAKFFEAGPFLPARTTVSVGLLDNYLIEIDGLAVLAPG